MNETLSLAFDHSRIRYALKSTDKTPLVQCNRDKKRMLSHHVSIETTNVLA